MQTSIISSDHICIFFMEESCMQGMQVWQDRKKVVRKKL